MIAQVQHTQTDLDTVIRATWREGYGAGITGIPNLNFDRAQDSWIPRGG